ncbi:EAL domain-containing protein [Thermodesulfobacterium sp. TA1]|uniref:EAL domain-containing protein n=1 Tax=Thermodesulfobacterium sp. TA1 TaxID=2234087 RepID=UPI0012328167|nr:EAL domain-containing protein [Thermodesulfobacterium sp. TA1]QER42845.1 EAL domain-containing protein [Thermodesulfobacterium sp. TA1]
MQEIKPLLIEGNLDIYFQPVVNLFTGKVLGFEALVRGINQEKNLIIPPNVLFELAKKEGVLIEFDRTCKDLAMKKFKDFGLEKDFLLFLNVNSETIDLGLAGTNWIKKRIRYYGINPKAIVVEISEAKIIHTDKLIAFAEKYLNYGFSIALDDFGTRHSNLERLIRLDIQYLKLAKTFIEDLPNGEKKQKLLEVIDILSQKLDFLNIAEGVETWEEALFLKQYNISLAQGYFFSYPNPNPREALFLAEKKIKELELIISNKLWYNTYEGLLPSS